MFRFIQWVEYAKGVHVVQYFFYCCKRLVFEIRQDHNIKKKCEIKIDLKTLKISQLVDDATFILKSIQDLTNAFNKTETFSSVSDLKQRVFG